MYFFPWALLFFAGLALRVAPFASGFTAILSQISSVCLYYSFFYGIMLIADKRREKIIEKSSQPPKNRKRAGGAEKLIKKARLRKKDAAEPADPAAPQTELSAPPEADPAAREAKRKKALKSSLNILSVFYVAFQLYFVLRFTVYLIFDSGFSVRTASSDVNFLHIGITVALAVLFFSVGMWMKNREKKRGSETARIFIMSVGVQSAVTAFLLTLNVVLGFSTLPALLWFMRLFPAVMLVLMCVGMAAAMIKRELLTDFDYLAVVSMFKKGGTKQSLADFLEQHTGLSVKSLWSIRYAASILPAAVLALAGVLFLSTCLYKVEPYQQAVVYRFGAIRGDAVVGEGIHFKLPWPIEKTELYNVSRVRELSIGYEDPNSADNLWTQSHAGEEYKLLLGNGNELVSVNIKMEYVIDDLYRYVTSYTSPEDILSARAYELVMEKTITSDLNTILSVDRSGLSEELLKHLNEFCREIGFGLHVNEVLIESIHPPIDVADVYQGVVSAQIQKNTLITNAEASAAEKIAAAEQEANTAIVASKSSQTSRVSEAQAELDVFLSAARAYRSHPDALTLAKYLDTFETVVSGRKIYVFIGKPDLSNYMMNFSGATLFSQASPSPGAVVGPTPAQTTPAQTTAPQETAAETTAAQTTSAETTAAQTTAAAQTGPAGTAQETTAADEAA